MFKFPRRKKPVRPTEEVEKALLEKLENDIILDEIDNAKAFAQIYDTMTKAINPNEKKGMSDTVKVALISASTSLLGIVAVIRHEQLNVIASKAIGFVTKVRI